jgi:hypothetical protein
MKPGKKRLDTGGAGLTLGRPRRCALIGLTDNAGTVPPPAQRRKTEMAEVLTSAGALEDLEILALDDEEDDLEEEDWDDEDEDDLDDDEDDWDDDEDWEEGWDDEDEDDVDDDLDEDIED